MTNFFVRCALLLCLLNSSPSQAAPILCDIKDLEQALISLKISPKVRMNVDLFTQLSHHYGDAMVESLKKAHPYLYNPIGPVNGETVQWIIEHHFKQPVKSSNLIMLPFSDTANHGSHDFVKLILGRSYPSMTSIPLFETETQMIRVRGLFRQNDFHYSKEYFTEIYEIYDDAALDDITKRLYKKIFEDKNYVIASDIKDSGPRRLQIIGHGEAGGNSLESGMDDISYQDLAKRVHASEYYDIKTDIEFVSCQSGCSNSKIDASIPELKAAFLDGSLPFLNNTPSESFAFKFLQELLKIDPDFAGNIYAYVGKVHMGPAIVWSKKPGTNSLVQNVDYGSYITNSAGEEIAFNLSGVVIKLNKDNIANFIPKGR